MLFTLIDRKSAGGLIVLAELSFFPQKIRLFSENSFNHVSPATTKYEDYRGIDKILTVGLIDNYKPWQIYIAVHSQRIIALVISTFYCCISNETFRISQFRIEQVNRGRTVALQTSLNSRQSSQETLDRCGQSAVFISNFESKFR